MKWLRWPWCRRLGTYRRRIAGRGVAWAGGSRPRRSCSGVSSLGVSCGRIRSAWKGRARVRRTGGRYARIGSTGKRGAGIRCADRAGRCCLRVRWSRRRGSRQRGNDECPAAGRALRLPAGIAGVDRERVSAVWAVELDFRHASGSLLAGTHRAARLTVPCSRRTFLMMRPGLPWRRRPWRRCRLRCARPIQTGLRTGCTACTRPARSTARSSGQTGPYRPSQQRPSS